MGGTRVELPKILIVDDMQIIRDVLFKWFSERGFDVRVAQDGAEGVSMAKALRFSVIVMDVEMPRMNGVAAIREIREFDSDIPILILSGYSSVEAELGTLEVSAVLRKPFRLEEVEAAVRAAMRPAGAPPV